MSGQFRRPFWTVRAVRFPIGIVWIFHRCGVVPVGFSAESEDVPVMAVALIERIIYAGGLSSSLAGAARPARRSCSAGTPPAIGGMGEMHATAKNETPTRRDTGEQRTDLAKNALSSQGGVIVRL